MGISYNPKIVTDGLTLYYDGRNSKSYSGSGTAIYDLSGNRHHGTWTAGPTFNSSGFFNVNGSEAYIDTNTKFAELGIYQNPYTMEAFASVDDVTGDRIIFTATGYDAGYGAFYRTRLHNGFRTAALHMGHYGNDVTSPTIMVANTWYHMAWILNGAGDADICVNGEYIVNGSANPQLLENNLYNMYIGGGSYTFWGRLFYVRIYNRALNLDEIRRNYYAIKGK